MLAKILPRTKQDALPVILFYCVYHTFHLCCCVASSSCAAHSQIKFLEKYNLQKISYALWASWSRYQNIWDSQSFYYLIVLIVLVQGQCIFHTVNRVSYISDIIMNVETNASLSAEIILQQGCNCLYRYNVNVRAGVSKCGGWKTSVIYIFMPRYILNSVSGHLRLRNLQHKGA